MERRAILPDFLSMRADVFASVKALSVLATLAKHREALVLTGMGTARDGAKSDGVRGIVCWCEVGGVGVVTVFYLENVAGHECSGEGSSCRQEEGRIERNRPNVRVRETGGSGGGESGVEAFRGAAVSWMVRPESCV